jgi:hypothetical protein
MPVTYKKIASVTVGSGGASTIDFTSIPGTYTDLVLKFSTRTNRAGAVSDDVYISLNGVNTGYSGRILQGSGSAASSFSDTPNPWKFLAITAASNATASTFGNGEFYLPNYTGSTNKSASFDSVGENNATEAVQRLSAGLVTITSAITSIQLDGGNGDFVQHSTATLYGISKS